MMQKFPKLPIQTVLNLRGGEDARAAFSDLLGLRLTATSDDGRE